MLFCGLNFAQAYAISEGGNAYEIYYNGSDTPGAVTTTDVTLDVTSSGGGAEDIDYFDSWAINHCPEDLVASSYAWQ